MKITGPLVQASKKLKMRINELKKYLNRLRLREDAYSLTGGNLSEAYVLSKKAGYWSVYYSERGQKVDERTFRTEADACECFLNLVSEDILVKD